MYGEKRDSQPIINLPKQFTMLGGSVCAGGPDSPSLTFHKLEGRVGNTYRAILDSRTLPTTETVMSKAPTLDVQAEKNLEARLVCETINAALSHRISEGKSTALDRVEFIPVDEPPERFEHSTSQVTARFRLHWQQP